MCNFLQNAIRRALCYGAPVIATTLLGYWAGAMPIALASGTSLARSELASSGKLRAAINLGNPILATRDRATGEPQGVSVDLARELATRLGVPVELVVYPAAGKVFDGIKSDEWDVAFIAIDPERATQVAFSPPYVVIEGAYLVANDSPIRRIEDVDCEGVRVVVGRGSAYDLYLTRELARATLVRAPTSPSVTDMMVAEKLEVAAGVKQQLQAGAKRLPGLRLLDGRFMVIHQAIALPKGRPAAAAFVTNFVEGVKASGFVAAALKRHGIEGATVAAPAIRSAGDRSPLW